MGERKFNRLSNPNSSANADLVVGSFYTTTTKVLDNKDNDGGIHPGCTLLQGRISEKWVPNIERI